MKVLSEMTEAVLRVARECGADNVDRNDERFRVYVGAVPILKITGISRENPSVSIKPKLRGESFSVYFDGRVNPSDFKRNVSSYIYRGRRDHLLDVLRVALPQIVRKRIQ